MPVLAGAAHADRTAVRGHVRSDDDLRAARYAPSFAEDVELDLAKTVGESNLLRGRDVLIAKEDHAVAIVGPLDRGERLVVDGFGQIDTADLGAERGASRDNLDGHRRFSRWIPGDPQRVRGYNRREPTAPMSIGHHPRKRKSRVQPTAL